MKKTLIPATIIPTSLYVEREADRQLNRIVKDMGRPAYVLEARQMGKTNLLVHMKKRREAKGDVVAYFDLSTKAADAAPFFQSIIDTILNGGTEWQMLASDEVATIRALGISDPHREYDQSLRAVLRSLGVKRLVIVLDEIDSIVTTKYSDTLFAQIRSMYFSRINNSEYDRLTYVLSGVAEPSELIRDKTISPFNIGDKVYLSDFSVDEVKAFYKSSNLNLSSDIEAEIYRYTSGNPRMLWDICSALEDLVLADERLSVSHVRDVVERLYLVQFDRPPVDHIRVLAESDPAIRSAVSSIRWGAGHTVDAQTKGRLYLAGIVRYQPDGQPIIKNAIIDAALSDKWLTDITEGDRGLLRAAMDDFREGKYESSIRQFDRYRSQLAAPLPPDARFQLALAYLYTSDDAAASVEFAELLTQPSDDDRMGAIRYYYATTLHRLSERAKAIDLFRTVSEGKSKSRFVATNGLIVALYDDDAMNNYDEIVRLSEIVLNATPEQVDFDTIRASTLYTLSRAHASRGYRTSASEALAKALALSPENIQPTILFRQYVNTPSAERHSAPLLEAASIIAKIRVWKRYVANDLEINDRRVAEIASCLAVHGEDDAARRILELTGQVGGRDRSDIRTAIDLFPMLATDYQEGMTSYLWRRLDRSGVTIEFPDWLGVHRLTAQHGPSHLRSRALRQYLSDITRMTRTTSADLRLLDEDKLFIISRITALTSAEKFQRAQELIEVALRYLSDTEPYTLFFRLAVKQQEIVNADGLKDFHRSREAAREILSIYRDNSESLAGLSSELGGFIRSYTAHAERTLQRSPFTQQNRVVLTGPTYKGIGRNTRVTVRDPNTGAVRVAKFKIVEEQLRSGELVMVTS